MSILKAAIYIDFMQKQIIFIVLNKNKQYIFDIEHENYFAIEEQTIKKIK